MNDDHDSNEQEMESLRARAKELEERIFEIENESKARLVHAELKTHAVRAGMIDLDGLKLIETNELNLSSSGELEGAATVIASLRKRKPWLFGDASSSSTATPPPSAPLKKKLATEMSNEEWRAARADMLRNR